MQPYGGVESHSSPCPQVLPWVEPSERSGSGHGSRSSQTWVEDWGGDIEDGYEAPSSPGTPRNQRVPISGDQKLSSRIRNFFSLSSADGDTTPTTQQMSGSPGSQPLTSGIDYNQPRVSPYQHSAAAPPSSALVPWSGSQTYGVFGAPDPDYSAGSPRNAGRSTYGGTTEVMQPYGVYESHYSPAPHVQTWVEPSERSGGN